MALKRPGGPGQVIFLLLDHLLLLGEAKILDGDGDEQIVDEKVHDRVRYLSILYVNTLRVY